jgi:quercetin dioxygenase-like cupin family protein
MPSIRFRLCGVLALAAAIVGLSALAPVQARAEIDPKSITIVPFDKLDFKGKPGGVQIATVFGDSTKPGLYGIVIKWPPHANSRPHSHPNDRYITVLSGTWWINTGAKFNPDGMVPMKPGSFIIHHAGQIHYDGTKDEPAMIYIVGMGPAPSIPREDPSTAPKK